MSLVHQSPGGGPDPYYKAKVLLFATGAGFGLAGMSSGRDWLVLTGIAFLAVGVFLRLLTRRALERQRPDPTDSE